MSSGITVAIPAHVERVRNGMLARAIGSACMQSLPPDAINVAIDHEREGAAVTRQRALEAVRTEWVAFLDSDDEFLPGHLERLKVAARESGADYVFSWFVRAKGGDPLGHFGKIFDPSRPHHTTMTVMCRTDLALKAGFLDHPDANSQWSGEDWRFTLRCIDLGAHIVHVPEETWIWHRHGGNTSGVAGRGDAR